MMTEQLGLTVDWQQSNHHNVLPLKDNELHLWWLPLQLSKQQQQIAHKLLSDIQRDKYHRRATLELKQSYLAGRFYLLNLLGHYTATPAHDVMLSYSRLKKPYLDHNDTSLQFNFSDTTINGVSHGLFAFCNKHSVGVDLESKQRDADFSRIAPKRFSTDELDYVTRPDGKINKHRSLAIWTRKEAYGKATGKGINFKMNDLNLASPDSHELDFKAETQPWRLQQIQLNDDLISCVVHHEHQRLKIKAFNSANHIP